MELENEIMKGEEQNGKRRTEKRIKTLTSKFLITYF
jgi:hypothetical protein